MDVNVEVKLDKFSFCDIESARIGDTSLPVVRFDSPRSRNEKFLNIAEEEIKTIHKANTELKSSLRMETKKRIEKEKTLDDERIKQQQSKAAMELQLAEFKTLLERTTMQYTTLRDELKSTEDSLDMAKSEIKRLHEALQIEREERESASKIFENQIFLANEHRSAVERKLADSDTLLETARKQHVELETTLKNEVQKAKNELLDITKQHKSSLEVEMKRRIEIERLLEDEKSEHLKSHEKAKIVLEGRDDEFKEADEWRQMIEAQSPSGVVSFKNFSLLELKKATDNFHNSLMIGEGGYGCVYKGYLRNRIVAIKKPKHESSMGAIEFNQEVEILNKVRHPNLVSFIGACLKAHTLVFEFLPNGSLDTYLLNEHNKEKLLWPDRIRIASEICSALIFLHSIPPHGIAHGDLKPENILLASNYVSKLTDFGISQILQQTNKTKTPFHLTDAPKFTPAYCDPEFFSSSKLTPQCDIYSYGIIVLQLVTGRTPISIKDFVENALDTCKLDNLVDSSAGEWPIEEAIKLAQLGLKCSDQSRRKMPDLVKDVLPSLESMKLASLYIDQEVSREQ